MTPNANGSPNDIAVYIQKDTKIKVYVSINSDLGYVSGDIQEWTLSGKNRRLNTNNGEYTGAFTIFARINKNPQANGYNAYLVFSKQAYYNGEWLDTHSSVTGVLPGLTPCYYLGRKQIETNSSYWYVRLGEVSAIDPSTNQRTVTLDTGILGTEQYNNEWKVIEDAQPLRVDISNNKQSSTPRLNTNETIRIKPSLIKGFDKDLNGRVEYWTIERNTGDAFNDAIWNASHAPASLNSNGEITLSNAYGVAGDFNAAGSAVFTLKAWGEDLEPVTGQEGNGGSGTPQSSSPVCLATGSITIYTEDVICSSFGILDYNGTPVIINDANADSTYVIGDKRGKPKAFFNPNPTSSNPSRFTPAFSINQRTGELSAANGKLTVDAFGNVFMEGEVNATAGVFSGFMKKRKTVITDDNYEQYLVPESSGLLLMDPERTGTFVSFEGACSFFDDLLVTILFQTIYPHVSTYTDEYKDKVRGYVGNTILLYNNSQTDVPFTGNVRTSESGSTQSRAIRPGYCAALTYQATFTSPTEGSDAYEDIYLLYKFGKIR